MYDLIALIFGENTKSKKIYKGYRYTIVTLVCGFFVVTSLIEGASVLNSNRPFAVAFSWTISIVSFNIWFFFARKINRDTMHSLHTIPDLKGVKFRGGKATFIEPHGENVLRVSYQWGYKITVKYKKEEYKVFVIDYAGVPVRKLSAKTKEQLKTALVEAISYVVEHKEEL